MKRNVDLTQNHTFRDVSDNTTAIKIFPWGSAKIPWRNIATDEALLSELSDELLFTGSYEERRMKRRTQMYESGMCCECCGKNLAVRPWKRVYSLCVECFEYVDPHQLPWGMER